MRLWLFLAGINGAIGVAMAAVAAHAFGGDAAAAALADKASRVQLIHALALVGIAVIAHHRPSRAVTLAGSLFLLGILLFCGSVYALAFKWVATAAPAPFGGMSLIGGWLALAAAAFARRGGEGR